MDPRAESRRVLDGNRQQGVSAWDGRAYDFVCPSPSSYPFQWFWDSAFHAIALLHVDPERAKQELRCLLQAAQPDGFIPHMVLWERRFHQAALDQYSIALRHPYFTATIQPPVIARSLWRVYEATADLSLVRETLPAVLRFFEWLAVQRDPLSENLIAIIQPDESGLDASPKYDHLMGLDRCADDELAAELPRAMRRLFEDYRPLRHDAHALLALDRFHWIDVMFNAIYADGLECLALLSTEAGYPAARAAQLRLRARRTVQALLDQCWDDRAGAFWDLQGRAWTPVKVLTFSSLFPIILGGLDGGVVTRLVEEHLLNEREFWLPYPVPSVAASEPSFDPSFHTGAIWRGPSWVNVNWYLYWGLRQHGYADVADELARRTRAMVEIGGIREFFNPYTAEGMGARDFGWTTLLLELGG